MCSTTDMRTVVAGGGIAGLASALAMSMAGHEVLVTERASELREIGAALSLWPNALAALDRLGLGEEVRSQSVESPTASIRSSSGRALVRFDTAAMRAALEGLPVVILRADLQSILLHACRDIDVEVRPSTSVLDVRVQRDSVVALTDSGEERADALVGADGSNSVVRSWVVGQDLPRDCNRTAWRAVIANVDRRISDTWLSVGPGLQLIASPAPKDLAYWAADTSKRLSVGGAATDPKGELFRLFGGWHAPIPAIIEATPAKDLIINDIFDRRPPRRLSRDSVGLVGDAAHAMTPDLGQGACQALEDAAVLLACATETSEIAELFAAYEKRRLRHIGRIVRDSHAIGRLATTSSSPGAALRNALIRLTPSSVNNRRLASYASVRALNRQVGA
jgi:2-polyprenyl-6-methoxyphenol hydroxylase-like FAD-dependent oxidoreductase